MGFVFVCCFFFFKEGVREEMIRKKRSLDRAKYSLGFNDYDFSFILSGRDMIPTVWCLFWGTGNYREEELPQRARALTGGYRHICCLTVPLPPQQPLTFH